MKKKIFAICLAAIMLFTLGACKTNTGDDTGNNDGGETQQQQNDNGTGNSGDNGSSTDNSQADDENQSGGQDGQKIEKYDENDLQFDVPESWQSNFLAVFNEYNKDKIDYFTTTEFYYNYGDTPVPVMSISRFSKDQWEQLKGNNENADEKKLGESKDGAYVYTINYSELEYFQDQDDKAKFDQVKKDAKDLRDKIKITK